MEIRKITEAAMPTRYGTFRIYGFAATDASEDVVALVMRDPARAEAPLVRIHSQCLTNEIFGSSRYDCGEQLHLALERISAESEGILIYQFAEGRGIGLMNKLIAYELQDSGHDTVEANRRLGFDPDLRSYALCAAVLGYFGIDSVRLMSNNPRKLDALAEAGLSRVERVPIEVPPSETSAGYLRTKKDKLGHLLSLVEETVESASTKEGGRPEDSRPRR